MLRKAATGEGTQSDVRASLLVIDAAGEIAILSLAQAERGILLTPAKPNAAIGKGPPKGWSLPWPRILEDGPSVSEHFVLVLTEREIDLRFLQPRRIHFIRDHEAEAKETKGLPRTQFPDVVGRSIGYRSTPVHYVFSSTPRQAEAKKAKAQQEA